jgi:hypothetical protein
MSTTAERQRRYRSRQRLKQASQDDPVRAFERAAFAMARSSGGASPDNFIKSHWPTDDISLLVLRAAVTPAMTTDASMAPLLQNVTGDFVTSLATYSAAAQLFAQATQVNLDGISSVLMPQRSGPIDANKVPWVVEGGPLPVAQFALSNTVVLGPVKKMACLLVTTAELAMRSNAEEVFSLMLRETAALQLDTSVFSTTAATTAKPAGILNGITPLTAAVGGGETAMLTDLAVLAAAVGAKTTGLAYIAHPAQASAISVRRGTLFDLPVWPTLGVAPGTVIALDPAALATAYGAVPQLQTSDQAVVLLEDAPAANPFGAPTRSLFQTDCIALRLLLDVAYAWRMPGACAFMTGVTW